MQIAIAKPTMRLLTDLENYYTRTETRSLSWQIITRLKPMVTMAVAIYGKIICSR